MPRNWFNLLSRRPATEKARVVARIQRIGFIILGFETIVVLAGNSVVCLLSNRCTPAIPIVSVAICGGLFALLVLAFRNPEKRWPITALAIATSCAMGCIFAFMATMP